MFKNAIPVLHVESIESAKDFYCNQLGFETRFEFRIDDSMEDPCYMGLSRDDANIHISSFSGDAVAGGVVYLVVDDVDALHSTLVEKGVVSDLKPTDQTWGNREMYVKDQDGNCIRFIQEKKAD